MAPGGPGTAPAPARALAVPAAADAPAGAGLFEHEGEVVLGALRAMDDPVLVLRAAAVAAQEGLPLAPEAAGRLAGCPPLPDPWPPAAREALVALLGAGDAALGVWEALDQVGAVVGLIPEWAAVRSRPQRNAVHTWTVDRHLVETAAQAAALSRRVHRPDLLLVAALLHDIGKGRRRGDHAREGAKLARVIATRMGFPEQDVAVLTTLVRHHLLLVDSATRRDLQDPATTAAVAQAVGSAAVLALLHALTEADALATGPGVWSGWRAGLVDDLVRRTSAHLHGEPAAAPAALDPDEQRLVHEAAARGELSLAVRDVGSTSTVTVVAPDQHGLLAAAAGVLALHRLSVRAATMRTQSVVGCDVALDTWVVEPVLGEVPDADRLRDDLRRVLAGRLDVAALLDKRQAARPRPRTPVPAPYVEVVTGASATATVIEVRAHDRPALLHRLGRALSLAGLDVRAARVATMGAEVVDVFYVVGADGRPLDDNRSRETARILRDVAG